MPFCTHTHTHTHTQTHTHYSKRTDTLKTSEGLLKVCECIDSQHARLHAHGELLPCLVGLCVCVRKCLQFSQEGKGFNLVESASPYKSALCDGNTRRALGLLVNFLLYSTTREGGGGNDAKGALIRSVKAFDAVTKFLDLVMLSFYCESDHLHEELMSQDWKVEYQRTKSACVAVLMALGDKGINEAFEFSCQNLYFQVCIYIFLGVNVYRHTHTHTRHAQT